MRRNTLASLRVFSFNAAGPVLGDAPNITCSRRIDHGTWVQLADEHPEEDRDGFSDFVVQPAENNGHITDFSPISSTPGVNVVVIGESRYMEEAISDNFDRIFERVFVSSSKFYDFIELFDGSGNPLVADELPIGSVLRLHPNGGELPIVVTQRVGSPHIYDLYIAPELLAEANEGERLEATVPFIADGVPHTIRRRYVVTGGVANTAARARYSLALLTADRYIVPTPQGLMLYYVEVGTGTWATGRRLLSQQLFDVTGQPITDNSTFIARSVSG